MKSRYFIALILAIFALSCTSTRRQPASVTLSPEQKERNDAINADIYKLQELVEEALVWRVKSTRFFHAIKDQMKDGNLSSETIDVLYRGAADYVNLRKRFFTLIKKYEKDYFKRMPEIHYDTADGKLMMKEIKLATAAGWVLFDNYLIGIYPYQDTDKLRYLLNTDHPLKLELEKISASYTASVNRDRLKYGTMEFHNEKAANTAPIDRESQYLDELISQGPGYSHLGEDTGIGFGIEYLDWILKKVSDRFHFMGRVVTYITSMLLGNTMGLVETRKGLLLNLPDEEKKAIGDSLEPLDVLLEKTPFRLTDKMIPGHYGHVAIWLGNEAQLRELGIWEHPLVQKYQNEIRAEKLVVEALRPGVEMNTLEHFLNIDDILVLRHTKLTAKQKQGHIIRLLSQVGKAYDFNFDVETDKRIVCSEIAYVVFKEEKWPTSKTLGRYTISPDNVANKALRRNPFTPTLIYYDGKKVERELERSLELLLKEDYEGFANLHGRR